MLEELTLLDFQSRKSDSKWLIMFSEYQGDDYVYDYLD
jgi:hypothetical protein